MTRLEFANQVRERWHSYVETIYNRLKQVRPDLTTHYGPSGSNGLLTETAYNLESFISAFEVASPELFEHYLQWLKQVLTAFGNSEDDLADHMAIMRQVLIDSSPQSAREAIDNYFGSALDAMQSASLTSSSFINGETAHEVLARDYLANLLNFHQDRAVAAILDAVETGTPVGDVYLDVIQPVQHEIGRLWQENDISVAQEHYATAATQLVMAMLYPHILTSERKDLRVVATCVGAETHQLGLRIVGDFFEMAGWDTYYLGVNTPVDAIFKTLIKQQAHVLAISTTMTWHVPVIKETIEGLRSNEAVKDTIIMVGGFPFNLVPGLWEQVGADGYAADAREAVRVAEALVKDKS